MNIEVVWLGSEAVILQTEIIWHGSAEWTEFCRKTVQKLLDDVEGSVMISMSPLE